MIDFSFNNLFDYYPFGMRMFERSSNSSLYKYGFNGQESDDEIKGEGNSLNYKYRMYDSRIVRFFAVDPIAKEYPELTVYQHSSLNPIWKIELEGLEGVEYTEPNDNGVYQTEQSSTYIAPPTFLPIENSGTDENTPDKNNVSEIISFIEFPLVPIVNEVSNLAEQGSTLGSNLIIYDPNSNGRVFNGNQHTSTLSFTNINRGVKIGAGAFNLLSLGGDLSNYYTGAAGGSETTFNVSKTVISIVQPEIGVGIFILDQTQVGEELVDFFRDLDKIRRYNLIEKQQQQFIAPLLNRQSIYPTFR